MVCIFQTFSKDQSCRWTTLLFKYFGNIYNIITILKLFCDQILSFFSAEDDEFVFFLLYLSGLLEIGGNGPSEAFGNLTIKPNFLRIPNLSRFISVPSVATGSDVQILLPSSISKIFFFTALHQMPRGINMSPQIGTSKWPLASLKRMSSCTL